MTPAQILYSSNEKLEKIANEQGQITGGAAPVANDEFMHNGVKLKGKLPAEELKVSGRVMTDYDGSEIFAVDVKQDIQRNIEQNKRLRNGEFSQESKNRVRDFIDLNEGCEYTAYRDSKGIWTIGRGHTGTVDGKPITAGMKITKEKAEELYNKDFDNHVRVLNEIKTHLSENQKVALASLIFNVGEGAFKKSKMYKKLQAGDVKGASIEFDDWNKITENGIKVPSKGLTNRRKREKDLFLKLDGE